MASLTISAKGWIVIPAELRKKYGLKSGSKVHLVDYGGVLSIVPALDDPIAEAAGMLQGDRSLSQLIVAEHRAEVLDEQ